MSSVPGGTGDIVRPPTCRWTTYVRGGPAPSRRFLERCRASLVTKRRPHPLCCLIARHRAVFTYLTSSKLEAQMRFPMIGATLAPLLLFATIANAQAAHHHPAGSAEKLGKVSFPTTCRAEVQPRFERA